MENYTNINTYQINTSEQEHLIAMQERYNLRFQKFQTK